MGDVERYLAADTDPFPLCLSSSGSNCEHCRVRQAMQRKYLDSIIELYGEDFNLVKVPLETEEIRGVEKLKKFSNYLVQPFQPPKA